MATKFKENKAIRESLINQLEEISEIAETAKDQVPYKAFFKRRFPRALAIAEKFEVVHGAILTHLATTAEPNFEIEETIRKNFAKIFTSIELCYATWFPAINSDAATPSSSVSSSSNFKLPEEIELEEIVESPPKLPEEIELEEIVESPPKLPEEIELEEIVESPPKLPEEIELEEIVESPPKLPEDIACEQIFASSVTRDDTGRYSVKLPFNQQEPISFYGSRDIALKRFLLLEKRLNRDPELRKSYNAFMTDYLTSGHMSTMDETKSDNSYFIPHHCVIKPDSPTTKLRVFFDASCKDCRGKSLNDTLFAGPTLLRDLVSVVFKLRLHNIVFMADIRQMFRQINIDPEHRKYQKILWRFSPEEPVQEYSLNTVAFGVTNACAYLAIRTLHQLADDEEPRYPLAAEILKNDIYCDDIVSGSNNIDNALELQRQLIELLKLGQFELRKWACNSPELLVHLEPSCRLDSLDSDSEQPNSTIKVLGLRWLPSEDAFSFKVQPSARPCTKRNLLSELARIFNPLGFLAPLTFFAKHLIQTLWCLGLSWDELAPPEIIRQWKEYSAQLEEVSNLRIPRHCLINAQISCELHGFCDASEVGYAAVVYIRIVSADDVETNLLIGKTKLTPLKKRPLPQLELCGAQLLAKLIAFVKRTYATKLKFSSITAWCDSTITLCWIRSQPVRLKTFVSNRVAYIQDRVPASSWRHVPSKDNAADPASRGLLPSALIENQLWFKDPSWLKKPEDQWPNLKLTPSSEEQELIGESERNLVLLTKLAPEGNSLHNLIDNSSSLTRLENTTAYFLPFVNRPLCPVSTDPSDMSVLTPGHFLTLAPLTCLPDPNLDHLSLNRLSRWQLLQGIHQSFWKRWQLEYLHTLQQRAKWHKPSENLVAGQLVLIKGEDVLPLQWPVGRIEAVHPGKDGIVRVATIRTAKGTY